MKGFLFFILLLLLSPLPNHNFFLYVYVLFFLSDFFFFCIFLSFCDTHSYFLHTEHTIFLHLNKHLVFNLHTILYKSFLFLFTTFVFSFRRNIHFIINPLQIRSLLKQIFPCLFTSKQNRIIYIVAEGIHITSYQLNSNQR